MAPAFNNSGTSKFFFLKTKLKKVYILWGYDFSDCLSTEPPKNTAKVPHVGNTLREICLAVTLKR